MLISACVFIFNLLYIYTNILIMKSFTLCLIILLIGLLPSNAQVIINHESVDITEIPDQCDCCFVLLRRSPLGATRCKWEK